jgi:Chaperone of endosialidase
MSGVYTAAATVAVGAYSANRASAASDKAARAAGRGAELTAQGERDALDYQKEVEALPLELRNEFLPQLADIARGGQGQQDLINQAQSSPLYNAILGGQQAGEQSILRNAAATGGLRSGNVQGALTDYGSQLQNRALLTSYNDQLQGIQGLANQPLNTNAIAQGIAAPGQTLGQGAIAQGQIQQQGQQNANNAISNAVGSGLNLYAQYAYSDIRLKKNIEYVGLIGEHNIYAWDWNDEAEELGLSGHSSGVMAHEVYEYMPEVIAEVNGYIAVNYEAMGLSEAA